jgi:hypothetical protein
MNRREFLGSSVAGGSLIGGSASQKRHQLPPEPVSSGTTGLSYDMEVTIEGKREGKPHAGKMLAAIQPHQVLMSHT